MEKGKTFAVKANNRSDANFYIQSAILNGQPFLRSYITQEEIMNGSELIFEMGSEPKKSWASEKSYRPYSENGYKVAAMSFIVDGNKMFLHATTLMLSCNMDKAVIRYTLNDEDPTESLNI